jgi:nucleolar protein 56
MTEDTDSGWFDGVDPDDPTEAAQAIRYGSADGSREWPTLAVESGFAESDQDYYDFLHEATMQATEAAVRERELADDQQLIHAVRAMDDCERTANELAERVAEWAGSREDDAGTGIGYARELAEHSPDDASDRRLVALACRVTDLADEADALRTFVEQATPEVSPNLTALAGPVLAARLIALSGGLESLAKQPSSTVQVLGAEDALFAHLQGDAPSPKHGIIYTHEYVRETRPGERGSAARALAGKLTIAARIDHYSGDRKPELDDELDDRLETIRQRGDSA